METLADLAVRSADHPEGVALRSAGDPARTYDFRRLATDARKTGNFLAHRGVREGSVLGVTDDPVPETVLSVLGAGLLGAIVRFDPPREADARAVVAPADRVGEYDLPPGGQRIGYGAAPQDPEIAHFEEEMWSENPAFPTPGVDPGDPVLATGDRRFSHQELLNAARSVAANIGEGDAVAVRSSLADPGTVAAGLVAPLTSGATVLLSDAGTVGSVAVAETDAPEKRTIDPRDVL